MLFLVARDGFLVFDHVHGALRQFGEEPENVATFC